MELSKEDLRRLQLVELELIKEVDRICRKNNIQYTLYAGTLLGAVRHKGFIPWDDDADIAFLPGDYEKFYNACKRDLNTEKFFLQDYRTDEHYRWGYAKLRRNDSAFIREGQEHMEYHAGICIDVFPLFYVPNNIIARKVYYFLFFIVRKCLYSQVGKINEKNPFLKGIYAIISKIPKSLIFAFSSRIIRKKHSKNVDLMYIPNSRRCKYGIPVRCLEETVELEFENQLFMCMKEYDKILRMAYGDYMQFPSESDRVSHNPASKIKFPE